MLTNIIFSKLFNIQLLVSNILFFTIRSYINNNINLVQIVLLRESIVECFIEILEELLAVIRLKLSFKCTLAMFSTEKVIYFLFIFLKTSKDQSNDLLFNYRVVYNYISKALSPSSSALLLDFSKKCAYNVIILDREQHISVENSSTVLATSYNREKLLFKSVNIISRVYKS